jgi:hypothetical protein
MNLKELIFNMYKETNMGSRKFRTIISKKYKLSDIEISNIYAKINNYQINKYGGRINKEYELINREEYKKIARNRRTAKYERLKRRKQHEII